MAREPLRLVPLSEVLSRLGGISKGTFRARWRHVFTPRRTNGKVTGKGSPRAVLSDELEVAVVDGPAAVLTYRRAQGRLNEAA